MSSDFKPILPDTAEFKQALKDIESVTPGGALGIQFVKETLSGRTEIEHALIETSAGFHKLVVLVGPLSLTDMERISELLQVVTQGLNIPGTTAEAGISPIYPKQFDFVLFGIPSFRAPNIRTFVREKIKGLF